MLPSCQLHKALSHQPDGSSQFDTDARPRDQWQTVGRAPLAHDEAHEGSAYTVPVTDLSPSYSWRGGGAASVGLC